MARGFVSLVAVIDWFSRRVLSHRVSITLRRSPRGGPRKHGRPESFNGDQGSQFTSEAFTGVLETNGIAISMDGKGAWRATFSSNGSGKSVKYEEVYLKAYDTRRRGPRLARPLSRRLQSSASHSSLDRKTPDEAYFNPLPFRGGHMKFPPPHRVGPPVGLRPPSAQPHGARSPTNPAVRHLSNRGNCPEDRGQRSVRDLELLWALVDTRFPATPLPYYFANAHMGWPGPERELLMTCTRSQTGHGVNRSVIKSINARTLGDIWRPDGYST